MQKTTGELFAELFAQLLKAATLIALYLAVFALSVWAIVAACRAIF